MIFMRPRTVKTVTTLPMLCVVAAAPQGEAEADAAPAHREMVKVRVDIARRHAAIRLAAAAAAAAAEAGAAGGGLNSPPREEQPATTTATSSPPPPPLTPVVEGTTEQSLLNIPWERLVRLSLDHPKDLVVSSRRAAVSTLYDAAKQAHRHLELAAEDSRVADLGARGAVDRARACSTAETHPASPPTAAGTAPAIAGTPRKRTAKGNRASSRAPSTPG